MPRASRAQLATKIPLLDNGSKSIENKIKSDNYGLLQTKITLVQACDKERASRSLLLECLGHE
jgi:hypothetical protein